MYLVCCSQMKAPCKCAITSKGSRTKLWYGRGFNCSQINSFRLLFNVPLSLFKVKLTGYGLVLIHV